MSFDVEQIRAEFPIRATKMRGRALTYLDRAASAQKPRASRAAEARSSVVTLGPSVGVEG